MIYRRILELHHAGEQQVDSILLCDALGRHGELELVGGKAAVTTLASTVPAAVNAPRYAAIVAEGAQRRRLAQTADAVAAAARNGGVTPELRSRMRVVLDQPAAEAARSSMLAPPARCWL